MAELKERLRTDLTAAMKSRDEVRLATVRMALTAITNEEVAGKEVRTLDDAEVLTVLTREAKKRREAAEAYDAAGRTELAARERAEGEVLADYLPQQLTDGELTALVSAAIAEAGATEMRQMGVVMKLVTPQAAGRADGQRVSTEVKRQLGN
ncbi:MAG: GatB/YqeY domain-containing protein [Jatrophihabitans sp.]